MTHELTGRLAPSPTGLLHVGHARSFLLAWWSVRARGGRLVLRLEDLDRTRVKPGLADACLRDLEWLGLDWDGAVEYQDERRAELFECARRLERAGLAYACTCTRHEIELARSAPHAEEHVALYPGTCRGRYDSLEQARRHSGREPALRLRVEPGTLVTVEDVLAGPLTEDVSQAAGDFPITSRDGQVAYQLAVVLDDARQGVTEVLRGDDLLASTPRQALLQDLLGLGRPTWVHVPLVTDALGERLAKRHDALSLQALRERGVRADSLVAWIARSAGLEVQGPSSARAVLAHFDLACLPRRGVIFDERALVELEARP